MGTRKKFSAAEQELLRANPYTEKVTEHQISFTLAFKEAFWRLSVEGCTGNMALRKLGYDPELLGFERVHNITKRIRRAGKSPEGIQPAPKSRMRISREQFGAAELEKMSRRESERRMQQEIVYLQQQMAFQDLTLLFKTLDAHIRQLNDQPVIGDRTAGYGQDGKQLIEADGFFTDQRCIQQPQ